MNHVFVKGPPGPRAKVFLRNFKSEPHEQELHEFFLGYSSIYETITITGGEIMAVSKQWKREITAYLFYGCFYFQPLILPLEFVLLT